jgi:signal transduction histidine kinase
VAEQLIRLRYLIVLILTIGTAFSAALGLFLALNLGHTIQQASMSILELVRGKRVDPLPEHEPLEIKTLQQAFNILVTRLHELEQNRKQLLSNLVHELGRPLGGLSMGLQVLRRGAKDNPQTLDELLEGMEIEVKVLRRLIEDLTILYDNIIGTHELDFKVVALSEWLPAILHSDQEVARKNGLQWIIDIPKDLPKITIDPQRIAQVVGNLTENAIKYTPRGGSINVTAGEIGKSVWIRVSDTGPGIPVEEQEKIFEPFYRGIQKQRIKQGMGLGLYIARDFVIAHLGRLEVESSPGSGSCFTIWLPKIINIRNLTSNDKDTTIKR